MQPVTLNAREFFLYAALLGAALGALFGLIPLFIGLRRGKRRLGLYGFAASVIAGAIAPLLSIVVVAVFSWLLLRKKSEPAPPPETPDDTAGPASL